MPSVLAEPVVERAMIFELQRADGVRDALDGIATGRAHSRTSDRCTTCRRCGDATRAGCGTSPDRAGSGWATPYRFWRAACASHREIRPPSCARTDRDFLRRSGCDTGCPCPARVRRAAILAHFLGAQIADIRLAVPRSTEPPIRRAGRNNRRRRRADLPNRSPASGRYP